MTCDEFIMEGTRLVEYLGNGPNVTVPEGTSAIDSSVFEYDPYIRTISLPSSMTEIQECAFWGSSLKSISIPGRVAVISHGVFSDCKLLQKVVLAKGVREIGEGAFQGCDQLSYISIPDTLESIYHDAFSRCTALEMITASNAWMLTHRHLLHRILKAAPIRVRARYIHNHAAFYLDQGVLIEYQGNNTCVVVPDGVRVIGENAFRDCGFVREVVLPSGVLEIGAFAFSGCRNLTKIRLPDTLRTIEAHAFWGCPKLTRIDFPGSLQKIGYFAFHDSALTSVTIPGNVKECEPRSFSLGGKLKEIVLENGVQQIHQTAFSHLHHPVTLTVPDSLIAIHEEAFRNTRFAKINASESWKAKHPDLWKLLNR